MLKLTYCHNTKISCHRVEKVHIFETVFVLGFRKHQNPFHTVHVRFASQKLEGLKHKICHDT